MVVQSTDHEVVIMFFLAFPPLLIGSPEDIQEQIAEVSGIDAECQARIIIAKDRMPGFVQVLQSAVQMNQAQDETEGTV